MADVTRDAAIAAEWARRADAVRDKYLPREREAGEYERIIQETLFSQW
jgi:hypothetical protein